MSRRRFRWIYRIPFRRNRLEREVEDEIAFHLAEKVRELEAAGIGPAEADAEARRQFGSVRTWREATLRETRRSTRRERRRGGVEALRQDAWTACRQLARRPGFALLTVLVLAAGVGTSTTVWAVLDAVLFRSLPFGEPDRVVAIEGTTERFQSLGVSPANYLDWKEAGRPALQAMAATRASSVTLHLDRPEQVGSLRVESDFFDVVGVEPRLGRRFLPEDDRPNAEPVAVLSHRLWTRSFGADPGVVGRTVRVGEDRLTVVGVMPPAFRYLDIPVWGGPERDIFRSDPFMGDRTTRTTGGTLWPVGRLADEVTLEEADARLDAEALRLAEAYPDINGESSQTGVLTVHLEPFKQWSVEGVRGDLLFVGGAALLLLAVVGVSVAGLLLARVMERRHELAVREGLGAGRGRLVRHVMLETGLLCTAGAAGGILVAAVAIRVVGDLVPREIPWLDSAGVDHRAVLGALFVSGVLWLASGLPTALRGTALDVGAWLKEGAPAVAGDRRWARRIVIVGQIALACGLVSGAAIVLETYARLTAVSPGVRTERVAVLRLQLPRARYAPRVGTVGELGTSRDQNEAWREQTDRFEVYDVGAEARDVVRRISEGLREVPGVRAVAFSNYPPLSGNNVWGNRLPPEEDASPDAPPRMAYQKWVSPDYFEDLGIRMLRGRGFTDLDGPDATPVLVVNEAFAARYLDGVETAVGTSLAIPEDPYQAPVERTVVGVVDNVMHSGPHDPDRPAMYIPVAQRMRLWNRYQAGAPLGATFLVRTAGDPTESFAAFREAVWAADPELPVSEVSTLEELHRGLTAESRFYLWLLGSFAVVALLLAVTGTLGLLSQRVQERTREIGIRRALGASVQGVTGLVLKEGALLAGVGITLGLGASWMLSRILASRVPGVEGWSPGVQLAVAAVLLAAALGATSVPARRAGRVDPMEAVRGG